MNPFNNSKKLNKTFYKMKAYELREHCVKSVRIWSYSGLYFPAFELNTERYCGKMGTRVTPNMDTFHTVEKIDKALLEVTYKHF